MLIAPGRTSFAAGCWMLTLAAMAACGSTATGPSVSPAPTVDPQSTVAHAEAKFTAAAAVTITPKLEGEGSDLHGLVDGMPVTLHAQASASSNNPSASASADDRCTTVPA